VAHGDVRAEDGGTFWVMEGEVDAAVQGRREEELLRLAQQATQQIVIDLSAVTFMDSGGLRLLYHAAEGSPEPPLLRGVPDRIQDLLELSGVAALFAYEPVAETSTSGRAGR
jgi:anti-sigma B factor antagonist